MFVDVCWWLLWCWCAVCVVYCLWLLLLMHAGNVVDMRSVSVIMLLYALLMFVLCVLFARCCV